MIRIVYNIPAAMKSGLKVYRCLNEFRDSEKRYIPYRDEKRTENHVPIPLPD